MKIKIEKKLKRFLKQHKAYKRFRKCVHEQNDIWNEIRDSLGYHKGQTKRCESILSSFVIGNILSDQQESDFWWNLNSEWQDFINQHTQSEVIDEDDEPTPYWWKNDSTDDPYKEENDVRENDW